MENWRLPRGYPKKGVQDTFGFFLSSFCCLFVEFPFTMARRERVSTRDCLLLSTFCATVNTRCRSFSSCAIRVSKHQVFSFYRPSKSHHGAASHLHAMTPLPAGACRWPKPFPRAKIGIGSESGLVTGLDFKRKSPQLGLFSILLILLAISCF